jgi:hypothetical protein
MLDELKDSWIGFVTIAERLVLLDVNKLKLWDYGMYSSFIQAFKSCPFDNLIAYYTF